MAHNKLRAKFSSEEVENNWAISYGDMITLLLGFFVLFFNIQSDTLQLNLVKRKLDDHFNKFKDEHVNVQNSVQSGPSHVPLLTDNLKNDVKLLANIEGQKIVVEFPGVVFFKTASDQLTNDGMESLAEFAKAVHPELTHFRLVVRGYTDARALSSRSRFKDNLELSAFRSIAAIRYLSTLGIKTENMRIAGYGESHKRMDSEPSELNENRKVVILIEPIDQTETPTVADVSEPPADAKTIEQVQNVEIAGLDRTPANQSIETFKPLQMLLNGEIKAAYHELLMTLVTRVTKAQWYQKVLNKNKESKEMREHHDEKQSPTVEPALSNEGKEQ